MTAREKHILAQLRDGLTTMYGDRLVRMVLYGSHARGDARTDSDYDVLVVLRGRVSPSDEIDRTGQFVADLSLAHNTVISPVFMSARRFLRERSPLLVNVRREGLRL